MPSEALPEGWSDSQDEFASQDWSRVSGAREACSQSVTEQDAECEFDCAFHRCHVCQPDAGIWSDRQDEFSSQGWSRV